MHGLYPRNISNTTNIVIYYCCDLVVTHCASTQQCRLIKSRESSQAHHKPEWHNTRLSFTFSFCADPLHFTIPPQRHPIADLAISNPSPLPCPVLSWLTPAPQKWTFHPIPRMAEKPSPCPLSPFLSHPRHSQTPH